MTSEARLEATEPDAGQGAAGIGTAHELDLYRRMLLIRRFEERVYLLYLQGEIPGTLHQSQGQEAVAVGVCDVLRKTDWITSTHRPHGHALAKGVDLRAAMAELFGKATGCCGGKGGSMHLGDPSVGMLPAIAIVGGGNTVVTGLGLAFKLMRTDQVAVCFFGDGASNEGAFHEGLNFAAVQHLPIVFACENNLYGASTPFHQTSLVPDVADRAAAYGVRGEIVDGMDVLAVREAAGRAVAEARTGDGPVLLECKTYRFAGHSRGDVRGYRSRDEEAAWQERDPIVRLRERLALTLSEADLDEVDTRVEAALEEAIEFARSSPQPRAEDALTGAYATVIGRESTP
jgi:TPP-dependent pyruvate/acetoin dehydrogenase alpha subunit